MEISDNLLCLFSAQLEDQRDSYVIEIPKQEITQGTLQSGLVYRVAMLSTATDAEAETRSTTPDTSAEEADANRERETSGPPVAEGDIREVDIEDIGDQGDGIARVEHGFVIIVPETEQGERVTIEITEVQQNVAFGEVKERQTHF